MVVGGGEWRKRHILIRGGCGHDHVLSCNVGDVDDVLAVEARSDITEDAAFGCLVSEVVDAEYLVVAHGGESGVGEEGGMVDGAVIDRLHDCFFFILFLGVVDVDKAVRTTGQ